MSTPFGQSGSYVDSMGTAFGQAGSKSAAKAKKTPFGQVGSSAAKKLGTPFGQTYKSTKTPKGKSVRPKNVNKNIKVSQSEIDSIKKLGMKKALQIAAMNKDSVQQGAVASFAEGVRRLYGDTRYQNAVYTPKASPGPVGFPAKNFTKTKSNFTYSAPVTSSKTSKKPNIAANAPKYKTTNKYGFKKNSIADRFGSSLKKAYLGK